MRSFVAQLPVFRLVSFLQLAHLPYVISQTTMLSARTLSYQLHLVYYTYHTIKDLNQQYHTYTYNKLYHTIPLSLSAAWTQFRRSEFRPACNFPAMMTCQ